jgi:hypothetical protein
MRRFFIQGFVASLFGVLFLAACNMAGYSIQPLDPPADPIPLPNTGEEAVLLQTAQAQLNGDIHDQEAQMLSATPAPLSFEDQIATAVAQTQEAQNANLTFDQRVQTAIAQTQAAIPLDQRIQTAIAQTQVAQGLTQVAILRVNTPTPILSNALTPIANALFNGAYVYKYGFLSGNKYLVTIQLANNVAGEYYAIIGNQQYKCSVMDGYPDRLYCTGPSVHGGAQPVNIYESTSAHLVYVSQVVLPQWTPTLIPYRNYCYNGEYCNYYKCPYQYGCCDKNCICNQSWCDDGCVGSKCWQYYDASGKCYYFDANGVCRYCKSGNKCRIYYKSDAKIWYKVD